MFFSLFYETCLFFLSLFFIPKLLYQRLVKGKYKNSFFKRFGFGFPKINKLGKKIIWIHAPSLGETKAIIPLVKKIKLMFDDPIIIFSNTTETGHLEACKNIPANFHVYLPFDLGWVIKPIMKKVSPDLLILCESDFWYNFLSSAKKQGAIIALVNGKLSTRSQEGYLNVPLFAKRLFSLIDIFCLQSTTYKKRFEAVGVPEKKMVITGNLKFDADFPKLPANQLEDWRNQMGIKSDDPVLVVGSSHAPEETLFLTVLTKLWSKFPALKVLIVPRHPERFNEVANLIQKQGIAFTRLSQSEKIVNPVQVILVDKMGLLRQCYQIADVAIVAGSYTDKVGGHNILEPSWYGVPSVFGPHMKTQPDLVELVNHYKAGLQVTIEELQETLLKLFGDEAYRNQLGEAGLRLVKDSFGATDKTMEVLNSKFTKNKTP